MPWELESSFSRVLEFGDARSAARGGDEPLPETKVRAKRARTAVSLSVIPDRDSIYDCTRDRRQESG